MARMNGKWLYTSKDPFDTIAPKKRTRGKRKGKMGAPIPSLQPIINLTVDMSMFSESVQETQVKVEKLGEQLKENYKKLQSADKVQYIEPDKTTHRRLEFENS